MDVPLVSLLSGHVIANRRSSVRGLFVILSVTTYVSSRHPAHNTLNLFPVGVNRSTGSTAQYIASLLQVFLRTFNLFIFTTLYLVQATYRIIKGEIHTVIDEATLCWAIQVSPSNLF